MRYGQGACPRKRHCSNTCPWTTKCLRYSSYVIFEYDVQFYNIDECVICTILIKCQGSMYRTSFVGLFGDGVNIQTAQFRWSMVYERGINMQQWCKHRKNKVPEKDITLVPLCQSYMSLVLVSTPHASLRLQTLWRRVLLEKLTGPLLVKKFPAFYGTRRFITAFTKARYPTLFWARSIQSMRPTHFLKIHFGIFLPFRPGSSKWSLSLRFLHQNAVCSSSLSHTCYVPRPSHSPWTLNKLARIFTFHHVTCWGLLVWKISSANCLRQHRYNIYLYNINF